MRKLRMCGLEYRVVFATPAEVPELVDNHGFTSFTTQTIYIDANQPPTRMRDTLVHEVVHAFLEASGIGRLLETSLKSESYDEFEETLIRLMVPSLLRLIDENEALVEVPKNTRAARAKGRRAR